VSRPIRLALILSACAASAVLAQELFIYPDKGQSQRQQDKDKYECYSWAKSESGFDPMAPPTTRSAPPTRQAGGSVAGGAVGGAAAGAALGAVGGAIAGNAGKGAAIGAGTGGLLGGLVRASQRSRDEENRKKWEQSEANSYGQARANYNRAYSACLGGRGYTVR
jgi:predicted lipid-binding transport protein (Tim44 family)